MKIVGLVVVVVLLVGSFFVLSNNTQRNESTIPSESISSTPDPQVDWEASFTIVTDGTQRTFAPAMYHNRSNDVFIQAEDPQIVHVKKRGVTWRDFFDSLPSPFTLDNECLTTGTGQLFCTGSQGSLKFYLNGEKEENVLQKEIQDGDKLLVSYGTETEEEVREQLQLF